MKLALETPTNLLRQIQPLTDFDFILAHWVLEDEEYAQHYQRSTRFKILDNSTNELLVPCSMKDMKKAAEIVSPDWIVAPDFLGDASKTLEAIKSMESWWSIYSTMPVVQGATLEEAKECAKGIAQTFSRISIPYDITKSREDPVTVLAEGRWAVLEAIAPLFSTIHLLGFNTVEEISRVAAFQPKVESLDTGVPVMMGLNKRPMVELMDKKDPTLSRMVPWEGNDSLIGSGQLGWINYNIAYLRKVMNGESW